MTLHTYKEHTPAHGFREALRVYIDGTYVGVARQRMAGQPWVATPSDWHADGAASILNLPTRQHALAYLAPSAVEAPRERKARTMATREKSVVIEHAVGTKFACTYKGTEYGVEVTEAGYKISGGAVDGTVVASLKRCTKAITGNYCDSKGPQTDRLFGINQPAVAEAAPPIDPPAPVDTPAPDKREARERKVIEGVVAQVNERIAEAQATRSTRKATGPVTKASQTKRASKPKTEVAA